MAAAYATRRIGIKAPPRGTEGTRTITESLRYVSYLSRRPWSATCDARASMSQVADRGTHSRARCPIAFHRQQEKTNDTQDLGAMERPRDGRGRHGLLEIRFADEAVPAAARHGDHGHGEHH